MCWELLRASTLSFTACGEQPTGFRFSSLDHRFTSATIDEIAGLVRTVLRILNEAMGTMSSSAPGPSPSSTRSKPNTWTCGRHSCLRSPSACRRTYRTRTSVDAFSRRIVPLLAVRFTLNMEVSPIASGAFPTTSTRGLPPYFPSFVSSSSSLSTSRPACSGQYSTSSFAPYTSSRIRRPTVARRVRAKARTSSAVRFLVQTRSSVMKAPEPSGADGSAFSSSSPPPFFSSSPPPLAGLPPSRRESQA
mmetsp:Transcript_16137/g.39750  ORF Transcript_16137/g.39750 Transcript_16137/m.39750 type:complete len:248 (+) Transcript_16137:1207-1950(+)